MVAIGKNKEGEIFQIKKNFFKSFHCYDMCLTTLVIPEGEFNVYCRHNFLTELRLNKEINRVSCDKELFDYDTCQAKNVNIFYE
jgi:hypothetical protein